MKTRLKVNFMGEEKEIKINHPDKNYMQAVHKYPSVKYKNKKKVIPRKSKHIKEIKGRLII